MNELYLKNFEKSFFYDNNILVLQDLLSIYYSQKNTLLYIFWHIATEKIDRMWFYFMK